MKTTKRAPARKNAVPSTKRAKKPNPAAQALGRLGGLQRKKNLSPARASELGRRAAFARHGKPWPPADAVAVDLVAPAVDPTV